MRCRLSGLGFDTIKPTGSEPPADELSVELSPFRLFLPIRMPPAAYRASVSGQGGTREAFARA